MILLFLKCIYASLDAVALRKWSYCLLAVHLFYTNTVLFSAHERHFSQAFGTFSTLAKDGSIFLNLLWIPQGTALLWPFGDIYSSYFTTKHPKILLYGVAPLLQGFFASSV